MMNLRINPLVIKDLKEIRYFIADNNLEKGAEMIEKIYSKFEDIQMFPGIGINLSKRVSIRADYKYAVCNDYVILYKVGKDYVEIYRIVNQY